MNIAVCKIETWDKLTLREQAKYDAHFIDEKMALDSFPLLFEGGGIKRLDSNVEGE
ncbi:MAG: hypothetical protein V3V00_15800 [Saprospiraceae bacterium]